METYILLSLSYQLFLILLSLGNIKYQNFKVLYRTCITVSPLLLSTCNWNHTSCVIIKCHFKQAGNKYFYIWLTGLCLLSQATVHIFKQGLITLQKHYQWYGIFVTHHSVLFVCLIWFSVFYCRWIFFIFFIYFFEIKAIHVVAMWKFSPLSH